MNFKFIKSLSLVSLFLLAACSGKVVQKGLTGSKSALGITSTIHPMLSILKTSLFERTIETRNINGNAVTETFSNSAQNIAPSQECRIGPVTIPSSEFLYDIERPVPSLSDILYSKDDNGNIKYSITLHIKDKGCAATKLEGYCTIYNSTKFQNRISDLRAQYPGKSDAEINSIEPWTAADIPCSEFSNNQFEQMFLKMIEHSEVGDLMYINFYAIDIDPAGNRGSILTQASRTFTILDRLYE